MFKIGDKVKVSKSNDNESYNDFKNKVLKVVHIARNTKEHRFYDESMEGMQLLSFVDTKGNEIPYSLYEYELECI